MSTTRLGVPALALALALVSSPARATPRPPPPPPASDWSWISLADVMTAVMPLGAGERALRVRFGGSWPVLEGACTQPCVANKLAPTTAVAVYEATAIREYTVAQVAALGDAAKLADPIRRAFAHLVQAKLEERGVWVSSKTVADTVPAPLLAAKLAPVDARRAQLVVAAAKQFVAGADHATTIAALALSPEDAAAVRVLAETTGGHLDGVTLAVTALHAGYLVRTAAPPPQTGCHLAAQGGHTLAIVSNTTVTVLEQAMPTGGGCQDPIPARR